MFREVPVQEYEIPLAFLLAYDRIGIARVPHDDVSPFRYNPSPVQCRMGTIPKWGYVALVLDC